MHEVRARRCRFDGSATAAAPFAHVLPTSSQPAPSPSCQQAPTAPPPPRRRPLPPFPKSIKSQRPPAHATLRRPRGFGRSRVRPLGCPQGRARGLEPAPGVACCDDRRGRMAAAQRHIPPSGPRPSPGRASRVAAAGRSGGDCGGPCGTAAASGSGGGGGLGCGRRPQGTAAAPPQCPSPR
eukprot:242336-Chlamydomonas_euryale.AAC.1